MNFLTPTQQQELQKIDLEIAMREQELEKLREARREYINRNDLNKLEWPDSERINNIGRNGGTGEHYEQVQIDLHRSSLAV